MVSGWLGPFRLKCDTRCKQGQGNACRHGLYPWLVRVQSDQMQTRLCDLRLRDAKPAVSLCGKMSIDKNVASPAEHQLHLMEYDVLPAETVSSSRTCHISMKLSYLPSWLNRFGGIGGVRDWQILHDSCRQARQAESCSRTKSQPRFLVRSLHHHTDNSRGRCCARIVILSSTSRRVSVGNTSNSHQLSWTRKRRLSFSSDVKGRWKSPISHSPPHVKPH